jgi:hypothetical protein
MGPTFQGLQNPSDRDKDGLMIGYRPLAVRVQLYKILSRPTTHVTAAVRLSSLMRIDEMRLINSDDWGSLPTVAQPARAREPPGRRGGGKAA